MYATMSHGKALNGYCLKAAKHLEGKELLDTWRTMVMGKDLAREQRFPASTSQPSEYAFALSYAADKSIIDFDWLDVGGEAMSSVDEDPARQKLLDRLKKTDCLMLCISGENFKQPVTDSNMQEVLLNIDAQFINFLIAELQCSRNNTPPSISIVITQYDLCKDREANTVFEDVKQIFPMLFDSKRWLVMVCAVTLGLDLGKNYSAPISPINMHIPVIFSLLSKMIRVQWEKIDQEQLKSKRNHTQNSSQIKEALRNIDSSKFQTPDFRLARQLKTEIGKLSTVILTHQTKTLRFTIYLDGKQIDWKDILG